MTPRTLLIPFAAGLALVVLLTLLDAPLRAAFAPFPGSLAAVAAALAAMLGLALASNPRGFLRELLPAAPTQIAIAAAAAAALAVLPALSLLQDAPPAELTAPAPALLFAGLALPLALLAAEGIRRLRRTPDPHRNSDEQPQ